MNEHTAGPPEGVLSDIRVLDMTGEAGIYCSKLLADLGADVIRIEPPYGHPIRRRGPFYHDDPSTEKSLYHFLMDANKRGVTLDIEHREGRQIFRRLVETADVFLETFSPGYLDALELGYEALSSIRRSIIVTSISPFGQTGPSNQVRGSNLICEAAGGLVYVSGYPEGPPLMSGADQAYYMAGIQAAIGTMIALMNRGFTGEGDHVDVSVQEAIALTVQPQVMFWPSRAEVPRRNGHGPRTRSDSILRDTVHKCKDGWVTGLGAQERSWSATVAWLQEEGAADDLGDPKYLETELRIKEVLHIHDVLASFAGSRTMDELVDGGQSRHLFIMPMYTARDVANDLHLHERGFFNPVAHPELGVSIDYPGPPYQMSETPAGVRTRAPLLGEHNLEIYSGELGIDAQQLGVLKAAGAI
jgi:crotonobetainyl-CoA:carnitine CoA-transferase CaiB-like acyl-CoA transferase